VENDDDTNDHQQQRGKKRNEQASKHEVFERLRKGQQIGGATAVSAQETK
jgi:hypothetical protein